MPRLTLSATILALSAVAIPVCCQAEDLNGTAPYTPTTQQQQQLNQQLAPHEPLQIMQRHQGVSNSQFGKLLENMRGLVKDMVQVDTTQGDPKVRVKAPFVNVDVENGHPNVNVNAPFVNVTKSGGNGVNVRAPFANISSPNSQGHLDNVQIKAPFVNVDSNGTAGSNVNVHAPFANIQSNPGQGTHVQAPFTNIGDQNPPQDPTTLPPGTNSP
jgi:hypothetical protein